MRALVTEVLKRSGLFIFYLKGFLCIKMYLTCAFKKNNIKREIKYIGCDNDEFYMVYALIRYKCELKPVLKAARVSRGDLSS